MLIIRTAVPADLSGGSCGRDAEDPPLAGDALEGVRAPVLELDPRTGNQVLHRGRDEDLSRAGERRDPGPHVDGDPPNVVAGELDLSGVQAAAHIEVHGAHAPSDRIRASDGPRGPVERRQETVARRAHLPSPEPLQLLPDEGVMPFEK